MMTVMMGAALSLVEVCNVQDEQQQQQEQQTAVQEKRNRNEGQRSEPQQQVLDGRSIAVCDQRATREQANDRADKNQKKMHEQQRRASNMKREHRSLSTSSSNSSASSSQGSSSTIQIYPMEPPPPRQWISSARQKRRSRDSCSEFSVLSYNVLCDRLVNQKMFPDSPDIALNWIYRRELILAQLIYLNADVVALQELEVEAYETYFKPELLRRANYGSLFEPKSRARTMDCYRRRRVDGCAIFYKLDKFRLIERHLLEFTQIAIANAKGCPNMINRVMPKDNIGLVAILELIEPQRRLNPRKLLVCNTHIHWDPEFCDVKLIQTILLMNELECISKHHKQQQQRRHQLEQRVSKSNVKNADPSNSDLLPLVLLGDFNSLPDSGVLEFLRTGKIHSWHKDFKNFTYTRCSNALAVYNGRAGNTHHIDEGVTPFTLRRSSSPAWYYSSPDCSPSSRAFDSSGELSSRLSNGDSELDEADAPSGLSYSHPFSLTSAYKENSMPYTNYTSKFRAVIDYILFSSGSIELLGTLGPLDPRWLKTNQICGFPQPFVPSDHLPLVAKLRLAKTIKYTHKRS